MNLRDYQIHAVDGVFAAWKTHARTLVVLPTGCGKTVVFAEVIRRLLQRDCESRVLVLAHREELVFQARDKISSFTGIDADIEMAGLHAVGFFGQATRVVVSTIQTQGTETQGRERMRRFDPSEFAAVIVDEAHHATSKSYRRVIDYYLKGNSDCRLLGVTATPDRHDEEALGQVFDSVAYTYEIAQAINDGWLVPIEQQMVTVTSLDFSKINTQDGDLNQTQLREVLEEEENLHGIAAPTLEICRDKRALVFAASVSQAERICEIINRSAPGKAEWLCGETARDERRAMLTRFKSGQTQFLVNVGVLTEGFDDAGVEAVVMARPTKSRALYAQMIGRGIRPAAEIAEKLGDAENRRELIAASSKPRCLVIDFVGNAGRHKLISALDILGGKVGGENDESSGRRKGEKAGRGEEKSSMREEGDGEDARQRKIVRAIARFSSTKIDPFDRYDLAKLPECVNVNSKPISERDSYHLRKAFGKRKYERMTLAQKQFLVEESHRRRRVGQESFRQEKFLAKRGIFAPMRAAEASRAIEICLRAEGSAA